MKKDDDADFKMDIAQMRLNILKKSKKDVGLCRKIMNYIWSTDYKAKNVNTDEFRVETTFRNMILYLLFLAVLTVSNFGMMSLLKFYLSDTMINLFTAQPINRKGDTFQSGMNTFEDVWQFLEKPLMDGLYFETWYDGGNTSAENLGYILYQSKLLGNPKLTQVRVANNSCAIPKIARNVSKACLANFDEKLQSRSPFGKGLSEIYDNDITFTAWYFFRDDIKRYFEGLLATYPSDGFSIYLGKTKAESMAILADLQQYQWIDLNTRLIAIEFATYNGNVNLFTYIKLFIEFPPSGGVVTSSSIHNLKLLRYISTFDYFVMACEIAFIIFTLFYTVGAIYQIFIMKFKYFKDIYNCIECFMLIMSYISISFHIYRAFNLNQFVLDLSSNQKSILNFDNIAYWEETITQITAIILYFGYMKLFKYITFNRTLNQLNTTLKKCAKDICNFLVVFFIVFFAYGTICFLMFGDSLEQFNTFGHSLFTLFRIMVGDFDFVGLRKIYPIWGPFVFISFVFFCFFILLNMFVAIINESYGEVKEENARAKPIFMLSDYLKVNYSRFVNKLNLRKNRIFDIYNLLTSSAIKHKNRIEFETWRRELKLKGYADLEIEAIFSKYDLDCDRVLNEREKFQLLVDINKAKNNMAEEFINFKLNRAINSRKVDEFMVGDDKTAKDDEKDKSSEVDTGTKTMTRMDFEVCLDRINKTEALIATIINKIDKVFQYLEVMELRNLQHRKQIVELMKPNENLNAYLNDETNF